MSVFRRTKIFVERGMQLRFARFVLMYMVICTVLTATIVFFAIFALLGDKLAAIYPQHRLMEIYGRVYVTFFLCLLASAPLLFYGALLFSHRIAGPLPKIYKALDDIGAGNLDVKVTLRKHDELVELADHINRMTARLKERGSSPEKNN